MVDLDYDAALRLTNVNDWIDSQDGIEYVYDAANYLREVVDYDDTSVEYSYDDGGRLCSAGVPACFGNDECRRDACATATR